MKVVKNIRSSQEQEIVTVYPTETHVLLNMREVLVGGMDEATQSTQYEYDMVVLEGNYANPEVQAKCEWYKKYLSDTDFKMTTDYYDTMTSEEQLALTTKRAEARAYLVSCGY